MIDNTDIYGDALPPFTPSNSNPYLSIAKYYGVDYGDLLLYADCLQGRIHNNTDNILRAYNIVAANPHEVNFKPHVIDTIKKIRPDWNYKV